MLLIFGSVIAEDSGSGCSNSNYCHGNCSDPKSDHCGRACSRPTEAIDSNCVLTRDFFQLVKNSVQFNEAAAVPEWHVCER